MQLHHWRRSRLLQCWRMPSQILSLERLERQRVHHCGRTNKLLHSRRQQPTWRERNLIWIFWSLRKRTARIITLSRSCKFTGRRARKSSLQKRDHENLSRRRRLLRISRIRRTIHALSSVWRSAQSGIWLLKSATLKWEYQHHQVQSNSQKMKKSCQFWRMTSWTKFWKKKSDWVVQSHQSFL